MLNDIALSTLRWVFGLTLGSFAGLLLATATSSLSKAGMDLRHVLNFLRAVPIIGLVPLVQMHVGVREYGKIGLIAWGVMFPIWLTVHAARSRRFPEAELMFMGACLDAKHLRRCLTLPKTLGGLVLGAEIGIGIAWLCVVAAEWVGTYTSGFWSGGLGYRLIVSYERNDWRSLYLSLCLFGALGIGSSVIYKRFISFLIRIADGFDPVRWLKRG